jgi:RecJ-like exonuclease
MPFTCPTCEGKREVTVEGKPETCFTCHGMGTVDPAIPPRDKSTRGFIRDVWRIFFGG